MLKLQICFFLLWWSQMQAQKLARRLQVPFDDEHDYYYESMATTCPEYANNKLPLQFTNTKLSMENSNRYMDYDIVITENYPRSLLLQAEIESCASMENPDTCIKMPTAAMSRFCFFLDSETQFYSTMLTCMKPRLKCPITKGTYVGKNCTVDMTKFKIYPTGTRFWKTSIKFVDPRTKRTVGCFFTGHRMVPKAKQ